jgi:hypothetical protein
LCFDGRSVTYGFGELNVLVPAYAATIHKSQGSEYPAVVIPIRDQQERRRAFRLPGRRSPCPPAARGSGAVRISCGGTSSSFSASGTSSSIGNPQWPSSIASVSA